MCVCRSSPGVKVVSDSPGVPSLGLGHQDPRMGEGGREEAGNPTTPPSQSFTTHESF